MNKDQYTGTERIRVGIFPDARQASQAVAREIVRLVSEKSARGEKTVLGLATGSSPVTVYNELIRLHQTVGISFRDVITFNLDEYFGMAADSLQSYHRFMKENLFDHVDILPENIHIPDGSLTRGEVGSFCEWYEEMIREAGGIDLQILGIGRTGHIGFNEPGSPKNSDTRLVTLDHLTRIDAASDFFGEENVPRYAISMGIGTILRAKKIILLAWGEGKTEIIRRAAEDPVSETVPASFLQEHPDAKFVISEDAASELARVKTPWLFRECDWDDPKMVRKAVSWLCFKLGKPILKLTDTCYTDNGLGSLLEKQAGKMNRSYRVNIATFNQFQKTITGWPGGKPDADDSARPERAVPFPKRVLIFSPHPDDDVISMGGTLIRLIEQGHDVHIAYQTSGNIAVFDDDVIQHADFVIGYGDAFHGEQPFNREIFRNVVRFIRDKKPGEVDSDEIQAIKTLIREAEARAACRYVGIQAGHCHFLDMPFYNSGTVRKLPLSEKDVELVANMIDSIQPHQVYAAGDLSDPHGTHRVCFNAIRAAIGKLKNRPWMKDCYFWLYRGAWQEWPPDQVDMAVPLSPDEVLKKRRAIFKHQSQKDRPLFPGIDEREFWQRAEARNRNTAVLYDRLGLAEYEAIEVFVRYFP